MTPAIIGAGSIGSVLAANLARGREDVMLASCSPGHAQAAADHVGELSAGSDRLLDELAQALRERARTRR